MWSLNKVPLVFVIELCVVYQQCLSQVDIIYNASLSVDVSLGRTIPETLFGISFEEINHAGAGGLWAELVSNRGFEAGGGNTDPVSIAPWSIIGADSQVALSTDRTSCFSRNNIALRMDVFCNFQPPNKCPTEGVGVYNPGYWGMNIEQGKAYKVILYHRSKQPIDVSVSLSGSNGSQILATTIIKCIEANWTKAEVILTAKATDHYARLQLTATSNGVIWFDQVSAMPMDTYKGHGFRNDLFSMMANLQPRFLRIPGGYYVNGNFMANGFQWKRTIGPWENRPGHFGDVWNYWSDDGLGYMEYLQLAEDLNAIPIWVFNNGISLRDQVDTSAIEPFVQEVLDSIEFARGNAKSQWGSVRAKLGHPKPFDLRYVAIGNEGCRFDNYRGNYLKFYAAIKKAYPDIQIISNCDASGGKSLDHPADFYDVHIYSSPGYMSEFVKKLNQTQRTGPKVFVSEYAAIGKSDVGEGNLLGALSEAFFLLGIEKISDVVSMASYAPLFANINYRNVIPDAIVFDTYQHYGTPSYWLQTFFIPSSGSTLLNSTLDYYSLLLDANAIAWQNSTTKNNYVRIKLAHFNENNLNLTISIKGLGANSIQPKGSVITVLSAGDAAVENSFAQPNKIVPVTSPLANAGTEMQLTIGPWSFTSLDLLYNSKVTDL